MNRQSLSSRVLLFCGTVMILAVLAYGQAPARPASLILAPDEGDRIGSHHIKADPQTGSRRLGAGLQRLQGGQGIPVHMHEQEDEILFVHSGSGVGAVGDERRNIESGTTPVHSARHVARYRVAQRHADPLGGLAAALRA